MFTSAFYMVVPRPLVPYWNQWSKRPFAGAADRHPGEDAQRVENAE